MTASFYNRAKWLSGKESACPDRRQGDTGSIPQSGEGNGTQSSILAWKITWTERSLVGYSPQGHKQSDTTEHTPHMYLV